MSQPTVPSSSTNVLACAPWAGPLLHAVLVVSVTVLKYSINGSADERYLTLLIELLLAVRPAVAGRAGFARFKLRLRVRNVEPASTCRV